MASTAITRLDIKDYLRREAKANAKSEYFYGRVSAVADSTNLHRTIVSAIVFQLASKLAKRKCLVFHSAAIETPNSDAVFYADISIHSDHELTAHARTTKSPILIAEVLSRSTRRHDLTTKRKEYFRIPSLRHYLLVDTESTSAMLYTREANQTWPKHPLEFTGPKATIPLTAFKINLKLRDIYHQTDSLA